MRCLAAILGLALIGCSQPAAQRAEPTAPEERHELRGEVVSIDLKEQTIRIKHEEIKGWMDAMTMDFPVKDPSELKKVKPGDRITATVFVRDLDYHVGNIQVQPKP